MSADKRSVTTDALDTLGMIITENEKRDAIHLAVDNAVAGEKLAPGEDVGFLPDGTFGSCDNPIGIVDPFLKKPVKKGERFWIVIYPRKITSLRHVWEHPDFPEQKSEPVKVESKPEPIAETATHQAVLMPVIPIPEPATRCESLDEDEECFSCSC